MADRSSDAFVGMTRNPTYRRRLTTHGVCAGYRAFEVEARYARNSQDGD